MENRGSALSARHGTAIRLSDHFSLGRLVRFTLPSIIMLVFTSVYGVADGFFVSNFVGKTEFTAVNFIMPFLMILGSVGFMFGTGGGALIGKLLGSGDRERAEGVFSLVVAASIVCGLVLAAAGCATVRPLAAMLGAEGAMLEHCVTYARIILSALPFFVLQYAFQCLFSTAEKPKLGLYVTVAAGMTNIILDALFVAVLKTGLPGAAAATALGQCVGGIIPLVYFLRPNTSLLRLVRPRFDGGALARVVTNGFSELLSNVSMSVVSILYNMQLLAYAGEDGVAAYGVLMYVSLTFLAVFIGYSVGMSPVVSYHFGAGNVGELRSLLRKNLAFILVSALAMFVSAELLGGTVARLFVGYDDALCALTHRAFFFFSFSFLFAGFSIMGSSFFTALNSGILSALVSFLRTLVFQVAALFVFPLIWRTDGIWLSIVAAEVLSVIVTATLLVRNKRRFLY